MAIKFEKIEAGMILLDVAPMVRAILAGQKTPEHGVWALVRDEPPDDSPWLLGVQRVAWRDDDCA